jgi:hypothetical protein
MKEEEIIVIGYDNIEAMCRKEYSSHAYKIEWNKVQWLNHKTWRVVVLVGK